MDVHTAYTYYSALYYFTNYSNLPIVIINIILTYIKARDIYSHKDVDAYNQIQNIEREEQ